MEEPRTKLVAIKHMVGHPYGMITGLKQQRDPDGSLYMIEMGTNCIRVNTRSWKRRA